ncbi:MAG: hypothetical protein ACK2VD_05550 [Anaerolineae bacterium]
MRTFEGGRVTRSEWGWVVAWSSVALLLGSVPYLVGAALSGPEARFGGAVYGTADVYSYLAKMRQGAGGAWLFHIPYTPEPHPATAIYLYYLLLGKLAALSGLPLVVTYHLARVVCGALLLAAAYDFLAHYASRPIRRIAFLLFTFSSGLGWLLVLIGRGTWLGTEPLDLLSPEAYPFLTNYLLPHLAFATAALLWGVTRVAGGAAQGRWKAVLGGSGAFLLVALIGPFYVLVPYAVLGVDWLLTAFRRRKPGWPALGWIALSGLPAAMVLLYDAYYFTYDPVYHSWAAQNVIRSLPPLHYLAGYLMSGTLAALGLWWAARRRRLAALQLPLAWLAIAPLLLYVPFSAQRRLIIGFPAPLSLFAALGAVHAIVLPFGRSRLVRWLSRWPRYSRAGMRRWLILSLVLLTVPTNLFLVIGNGVEVTARALPIFRPRAELDALSWLAAHCTPGDVVLSGYQTGNYVPVVADVRVVFGLGTETVDAARKEAEVRRFFDGGTADAWRQQLLARYGVDYVLWGPEERELGSFDPHAAPYLDTAYEGSCAIYRVVEEAP